MGESHPNEVLALFLPMIPLTIPPIIINGRGGFRLKSGCGYRGARLSGGSDAISR
jgi:hypothetical protein